MSPYLQPSLRQLKASNLADAPPTAQRLRSSPRPASWSEASGAGDCEPSPPGRSVWARTISPGGTSGEPPSPRMERNSLRSATRVSVCADRDAIVAFGTPRDRVRRIGITPAPRPLEIALGLKQQRRPGLCSLLAWTRCASRWRRTPVACSRLKQTPTTGRSELESTALPGYPDAPSMIADAYRDPIPRSEVHSMPAGRRPSHPARRNRVSQPADCAPSLDCAGSAIAARPPRPRPSSDYGWLGCSTGRVGSICGSAPA